MFVSPAAPNASLVHVTPPRKWSDATFTVECGWSLPLEQRSCGWAGARSSAAIDRALEAARAAGGGVVYLPRGQYCLPTQTEPQTLHPQHPQHPQHSPHPPHAPHVPRPPHPLPLCDLFSSARASSLRVAVRTARVSEAN